MVVTGPSNLDAWRSSQTQFVQFLNKILVIDLKNDSSGFAQRELNRHFLEF
jgi:hypothetical protein